MKDFCQYGNRRDDEWEILPWIPDPRPPFKIWVKPEQIAPFFLIPHHPYAISLLLKISDGFRTEKFRRLGLTGSSADWERLVRGVIQEFEENNSGVDLFHFDSDEDVFCVYSQYIEDVYKRQELSITAEQEETLQPITNTEPVDNEFFLRDGAVYFSGLYENGLLKEVAPKDFCCWHYWGKSSAYITVPRSDRIRCLFAASHALRSAPSPSLRRLYPSRSAYDLSLIHI